jgi:MFS family permease
MNPKFFPIYILTVINGLSMMMLFPVLPSFISLYGQSAFMLGILVACYSFFQLLAAPFLGALSDKYGRKPILIITQAGTFLSWIILGSAYFLDIEWLLLGLPIGLVVILFSRMVDGITGGNSSVANAMVADLTTKEERTIVYGHNGAIMGVTLILGPAIGSFSLNSSYGFLGTAMLGALLSFMALVYMAFSLKETIKKKKSQLVVSFNELNLIAQIKKWKQVPVIQMAMSVKTFFYLGFFIYTTISPLYLMDVFGFKETNVGYYLAFTGGFLIFHQIFSIKRIVPKFGNLNSFLLGQAFMAAGYAAMALSSELWVFTIFYFVGVLGISLSMTSLQGLFSLGSDEDSQGEIMGIASGIESFLMILGPLLGAWLYSQLDFSIFFVVALMPVLSLAVYGLFFHQACRKITS